MNTQNIPSLPAWEVNLLRLTAFPSPTANISNQDWWSEIVGETPQTITQSPKTGEYHAEGLLRSGKFRLDIQPNRIDWVLTIAESTPLPFSGFQTIGIFPDILETFMSYSQKWFSLKTCPTLQRIAFGAVLFQPTESKEAGYELLAKYLPAITLDPIGSSDFLYSINRPRESKVTKGVYINRLSRWSVLSHIQFKLGIFDTQMRPQPVKTSFGCLLELDINTKQEFSGEFSLQEAANVLGELIELGKEIASDGDVK